MKIILARKEHLSQAAKILSSAYLNSFKEAEELILNKIRFKECFIAVEKNKVLGVLVYNRDYSHYANYVSDIAVAKNHRRKGVANSLFEKFIAVSKREQPKKQKYALSSTVISNKVSVKMHLNFGFKKLGVIKNLHYAKDEIIFGYKLY